MAWRDNASVKYEEHQRPAAVFEGDSRLDGRGYEMFRSVCGSPFNSLIRFSTENVADEFIGIEIPAVLWAALAIAARVLAVMKTGTLSKAAGSAYAEFGNSKVMAGG